MKGMADIEPGVCGFSAKVVAECADEQNVRFSIDSPCEKVCAWALELGGQGEVDAWAEVGGTAGIVLGTAQKHLKGCCSACAVPMGAFKAMQVAAGLALPKDVGIKLKVEE